MRTWERARGGHRDSASSNVRKSQTRWEHPDSTWPERLHLVCGLQSFANVCWGKKKSDPDSMRKASVSDWPSIIDVCHRCGRRAGEWACPRLAISALPRCLYHTDETGIVQRREKVASKKEGDGLEWCRLVWQPPESTEPLKCSWPKLRRIIIKYTLHFEDFVWKTECKVSHQHRYWLHVEMIIVWTCQVE